MLGKLWQTRRNRNVFAWCSLWTCHILGTCYIGRPFSNLLIMINSRRCGISWDGSRGWQGNFHPRVRNDRRKNLMKVANISLNPLVNHHQSSLSRWKLPFGLGMPGYVLFSNTPHMENQHSQTKATYPGPKTWAFLLHSRWRLLVCASFWSHRWNSLWLSHSQTNPYINGRSSGSNRWRDVNVPFFRPYFVGIFPYICLKNRPKIYRWRYDQSKLAT